MASGILQPLACPPFNLWPLAFVALVPLFVALQRRSLAAATGLGWVCGFTTVAIGFYWLPSVLTKFSELPLAGAWGFTLALNVYQAGRWGLLGWLYAWAARRSWPVQLAFLAAHTTTELIFPLPFPWYLGVAVHDLPLLVQVADLGGPIAVSTLVLCVNLLVHSVFGRVRSVPLSSAQRPLKRADLYAFVIPGTVLTAGMAYGATRLSQFAVVLDRAASLKIGIVQPNLTQSENADRRSSLDRLVHLSRRLLEAQNVDLLVWSEGAVGGSVRETRAAIDFEMMFTRRLSTPTLFGATLHTYRRKEEPTHINSVLLSDGTGRICKTCRYDKQRLFPFGEYLPAEATLPELRRYFPHSGRFSPGPRRKPIPYRNYGIGVTICYEDIHPEVVNGLIKGDSPAHLLINMTNDVWFRGSTASEWHFVMAKYRAVEQRRFLVRATNTGISAVVDPMGNVAASLQPGRQATAAVNVKLLGSRTLFNVAGNAPWWLVAFCLLFLPRRRGHSALVQDKKMEEKHRHRDVLEGE